MQYFLESEKSKHTRTTSYNPESNGVLERMNLTCFERIRTLLDRARPDDRFWAEALRYAVLTCNVTLKDTFGFRSRLEVPYNSKPYLASLCILRCQACTPISSKKWTRLEAIMEMMLLMWSGSGCMYLLFNPRSRKIGIARHINCDEIFSSGNANFSRVDIVTDDVQSATIDGD